jgi:hypothetical protein
MQNNYYKEKERSMFTKELSKYDLNNDFQRALFFRDCLNGLVRIIRFEDVFSYDSVVTNLKKGETLESNRLRFQDCGNGFGLCLDGFLYKIMVELPELVKPLAKKHRMEYFEWERIPTPYGSKKKEVFEPSEEVKNFNHNIFEKFKEHFSTEENILKTLDHLSRIMKVEKKKKEDSDDD